MFNVDLNRLEVYLVKAEYKRTQDNAVNKVMVWGL